MKFVKIMLGAILRDVPRYCWHLLTHKFDSYSWTKIKNRNDHLLIPSENLGVGVNVDQKWTSSLHLPTVFPYFGRWLFKHVFSLHPIKFKHENKHNNCPPDVSFIIGHRGTSRIALLKQTLKSIAAQSKCQIECIIIEQDNTSHLEGILPDWVTHIFTPLADPDMPFSRSMAFNVGAQHAKSECLIFHDNDMLIGTDYAYQMLTKYKEGYDFINLKRFIFYLDKYSTQKFISSGGTDEHYNFDAIIQNLEGGGSVGASKAAYDSIGGFDERFIGWGGEDNEFWERAQTTNVWLYGFMPLIHLWHGPQAGKLDVENSTTKSIYNDLSKLDPIERIAWLTQNQPHFNTTSVAGKH